MLYNHVENCIGNLKSLILDNAGHGSLLIPVLKDRLPDEVTVIISRKFGKNIRTLDGVMEHFSDELSAQKNCSSPPNELHKHKKALYYTISEVSCAYCNKEGHFH
jgi:hypothetical protein